MSLEDAINKNTKAVEDLIKALSTHTTGVVAEKPAKATTVAATKVKAAEKVEDPMEIPEALKRPLKETKPEAVGGITYPMVQAETIAASKEHGREIVFEALAPFDVKTAKDLKPEQWGEYLTDLRALVASKVEADLA